MTVLLAWLSGCVEYDLRCARRELGPYESVPCAGVCINEVGATNREFVTDTADAHEDLREEATEDWVELFNNGREPAPLLGLLLERDDSGYARSPLPDLTLGPQECVLLVASAEPDRGELTLNFDLNSDFGTLRLLTTVEECVVDRLFYPKQEQKQSYGRFPADGGPTWRALDEQTPCGDPVLEAPRVVDTSADTGAAP